jgi:hypothetical protein
MNRIFPKQNIALGILLLFTISLAGCKPVHLKTLDLTPSKLNTGETGSGGSEGWCFSQGNPPFSSFSAGPDQVLVGFDNFFKAGADPFPCNDLRATVFRGQVEFDVSKFDSIVSADLLFDTVGSVKRESGETTSTSPPTSFATTLGMATSPVSDKFFFDNEVSLNAGPSFDIGVSNQVRDWLDKSHGNNGFVLAGPTGLVDDNNLPENNKAEVSFYGNFKLRIVYNPDQNPKAPQ